MKHLLTYIFLFILVVFKGYGQESGGRIRLLIFDNKQLIERSDTIYNVKISKFDSVRVNNNAIYTERNQLKKSDYVNYYWFYFNGMSSNSKFHISIIKNDSLKMNVYITCHFEHVFFFDIDRIIEFKEGDFYYSFNSLSDINKCILIPNSQSEINHLQILTKISKKHTKNLSTMNAQYIDDFIKRNISKNDDFCCPKEETKVVNVQPNSQTVKQQKINNKWKHKKTLKDIIKYKSNNKSFSGISYYSYRNSNLEILDYLNLSKFEAKRVKVFEITEGFSIIDSLPISSEDFPNLEELRIHNYRIIFDLKGIESFKKLKKLSIVYEGYETNKFRDITINNFSRVWKCPNIEELNLVCMGINDSIVNLKKLKKLDLMTYRIPVETSLALNWVDEYTYYGSVIGDGTFATRINAAIYLHNKYGQATNNYMSGNRFGNFSNDSTYYNDKNTKIIKNGKYVFYYQNDSIAAEGWYTNYKRDSVWLYFNDKGDTIQQEKYSNGKIIEANGKVVINYDIDLSKDTLITFQNKHEKISYLRKGYNIYYYRQTTKSEYFIQFDLKDDIIYTLYNSDGVKSTNIIINEYEYNCHSSGTLDCLCTTTGSYPYEKLKVYSKECEQALEFYNNFDKNFKFYKSLFE